MSAGSPSDDALAPLRLQIDALDREIVELLNKREVSDETFAKARTALGEHRLVNLIVFMGYANVRCAQKALAGVECSF